MKVVADYELADELGRGPHGTSYRARPPARLHLPNEWVVVKLLDHVATDGPFARVADELRLVGVVGSSYLIEPLEVGLDDGQAWWSTTYVERGSLADAGESLPRDERIRSVADAARGAHHLHEHGVAHRAIKPRNVLLAPGRAKLADLGLGHLVSPGQSIAGVEVAESLEFAEPGVVRGERAGRASDIWSLAATLHRSLTGRSIHPALPPGGAAPAIRHVLSTEPVLDDSLTPQEREVIRGCLDAERKARPADALVVAQLLDDLAEEA